MKTRRLVLPLVQMMPPPKVRRAHTHTHQQRPGMWHGPTGPRSRVHGPQGGSTVPSGRTARGRAARLTLGATCDSGIMLSDATVCSVASCSARFCPALAVICRAFKISRTMNAALSPPRVCVRVCTEAGIRRQASASRPVALARPRRPPAAPRPALSNFRGPRSHSCLCARRAPFPALDKKIFFSVVPQSSAMVRWQRSFVCLN